ncbi:glycosyltransferase family 32 protein [Pedobacter agri]|uniref:glycosyltransferase family 32 protein n=1 Tax=Pedobacter agri TaxID=454586 RepID=UPI002930E49C|nr:glycosyltransferase [Pedobacter agri]
MIPKIIHFCWFGGKPKTELTNFCINSWKKYLPEYKTIEWNETNFDVESCNFVSQAYSHKKWAFVSDYVRAHALKKFGGIYLDTDVEIRNTLNSFLHHGAFSGFEADKLPFTALWGSEKNHPWPTKVLEYYHNQTKFSEKTNTVIVSEILIRDYKVDLDISEVQFLDENIAIYPATHFCLDIPPNFAVHHFNGSWITGYQNQYKKTINENYILANFSSTFNNEIQMLRKLEERNLISTKIAFHYLLHKILKKLKSKLF